MAQCVPVAQLHLPTLSLPPMWPTPMLPIQPSPLDVIPFMTHPLRVGPQRASTYLTSSALPLGLLIPNTPILHVDGTWMLKSDSWKDIMHHWTKGKPKLGLPLLLRDWPHQYYNGLCGCHLNTKYYQQSVMVTEFLNKFQGNKDVFLEAYGCAAHLGHMKPLKAILDT
ncbi:hypothetical protein EDC04DRAFT_2912202 [Pisolithus marmoratus]|nr:hypothetical protein EDC04DRAFT_2912202 [Pisolithus marmoratus]